MVKKDCLQPKGSSYECVVPKEELTNSVKKVQNNWALPRPPGNGKP